jgi:hypothetical protein
VFSLGLNVRNDAGSARLFRSGAREWQIGGRLRSDERTGHFMEVKNDGTRFKGVAREPDGRDTPNA